MIIKRNIDFDKNQVHPSIHMQEIRFNGHECLLSVLFLEAGCQATTLTFFY